jgi:N-acetylglucosamine malate deacetylase 2
MTSQDDDQPGISRAAHVRSLPQPAHALVVCAHPDDESFGLGAVVAAMADAGSEISVLCFTHGEASKLGEPVNNLALVRADELTQAATVLGVTRTELLDYPDGHLEEVELGTLADHVKHQVALSHADTLLVFDEGGITGHPDHRHATTAAVLAAERDGLDVIAWAIPDAVAQALNAEFATTFVGRSPDDIHLSAAVDRSVQLKAIACHLSQRTDNPVLWRRLELLGDVEHLRYLRRRES